MAGKKRAIPKPTIHKIFKDLKDDLINEQKKVVKPSSIIWETISKHEQINRAMTPKAVYTDALKWWADSEINESNDQTKSGNKSDVSFVSTEIEKSASSSSSTSDNTSDCDKSRENLSFTITLSSKVWATIDPVPSKYARRSEGRKNEVRLYYILQPGVWTNILVDRISKHRLDLICTWSFKRAKVYLNSERFIRVFATCTTCGANLIGHVKNIPNKGDDIKFEFIIQGFNEKKHEKSRKNVRIGGSKAKEIFASRQKASVIKRRLIEESGSQIFEHPRGRDISQNAIRVGQCRYRQSKNLSKSPTQALEYLKATRAYGPSIHMTGLDPFFIIYGTPEQFVLYNTFCKQNSYSKVTCDATGGVVRKLGKFIFTTHHSVISPLVLIIHFIFFHRSSGWKTFRSNLFIFFGHFR